jgi:hypothetical protein
MAAGSLVCNSPVMVEAEPRCGLLRAGEEKGEDEADPRVEASLWSRRGLGVQRNCARSAHAAMRGEFVEDGTDTSNLDVSDGEEERARVKWLTRGVREVSVTRAS